MFDGEHGTALHVIHGNRASSPGEGKSQNFSHVAAGFWPIFLSYGGMAIQNSCLFSKVRTPV